MIRRAIGCWFVAALLPGPLCAQTSAPPITIELNNWPLRRDIALVDGATGIAHAATEAALRKAFEKSVASADARGRWFRASKLYLVDLPTVALSHTLGHEYGHGTRRRDIGLLDNGFALDNWPWPVPFVDAHGTGRGGINFFFDPIALGVEAGGYEAGRVRDLKFRDVFSREDVDYFSAAQLIYSRLEEPMAAILYLRDSQVRDFTTKLFAGPLDDMRAFTATFTCVRYHSISDPDAQQAARDIRRHAALAVLDLQLLGSFARVGNYLWTGKAVGSVPAITFGDQHFWPRATFALSPIGVARGGELQWTRRALSITAGAEKTEQGIPLEEVGRTDRGRPILAAHTPSLWSGHATASVGRRTFTTRLDTNFWNQAATGHGGAVEARIQRRMFSGPVPAAVAVSAGYKSAGYLAGAPNAARWFAAIGLSVWP